MIADALDIRRFYFTLGLSWWQTVLSTLFASCFICSGLYVAGRPGAKYGLAFPVILRASFGNRGAQVPALLRAVVSCCWYGILSWFGGLALFHALRSWGTGIDTLGSGPFPEWMGLTAGPSITYLIFWVINTTLAVVISREQMRQLFFVAAGFVPLTFFIFVIIAISAGQGAGPLFQTSSASAADFSHRVSFVLPRDLTEARLRLQVALALSISDFTRYAISQKAQLSGLLGGLPGGIIITFFFSTLVTSAAAVNLNMTFYWNPLDLLDNLGICAL
jgi:NCS1 family nucleobase:cation symporter-1